MRSESGFQIQSTLKCERKTKQNESAFVRASEAHLPTKEGNRMHCDMEER